MSSIQRFGASAALADPQVLRGWELAVQEFQHQAEHLEARGAFRAAVTLYDAIRIARSGGLRCEEHQTG
jgi:hypothetical protein